MGVSTDTVVALYRDRGLTMQQIADQVGVSKARVHQILQAAGVPTGHRYRPRPQASSRGEKAYRAYQMTPTTRAIIDRLAEALGVTRTAVVTRAIEELAERELAGDGRAAGTQAKETGGEAGSAGATRPRRGGRKRG